MEEYKLEQPRINKNEYNIFLLKYMNDFKNNYDLMCLIKKTEDPTYLHWENLKYKSWLPKSFTKEEFWTLIKVHRSVNSHNTKIKGQNNKYFTYFELDKFKKILNDLTFNSPNKDDKYLKSSIIEESISSSQLEGANTTRRIAKKILLEEKKPTNNSKT